MLSIYDEYVIGYKEWSALVSAEHAALLQAMGNNFTAVLILNGCIAGTWKRTVGKRQATVIVKPFSPLVDREWEAVAAAVQRYGLFLGLPVTLVAGE